MHDSEQNHYDVLNLPLTVSTHHSITERDLRLAYRRALLRHHPDKSKTPVTAVANYTVDQITMAYKILSDPVAGAEYRKRHVLHRRSNISATEISTLSCETSDLDDLDFDEQDMAWYRGCRCGKDKAFSISEQELESYADEGELVTACQGCSLWLKVTFAKAEDER